jgi:hypothetical protein
MTYSLHRLKLVVVAALTMSLWAFPTSPSWAATSCSAQSAATVATVVELYTSEGCSSCPPADRWLSGLKGEGSVVALAFHVDYWDRLGWKDRFASPAYTQRQAQQQISNGARFSYTPQIVVDGVDTPRWHATGAPTAPGRRVPASVDIQLTREGGTVTASVEARPGAPARLAAYWAITENGHTTRVRAGENEGAVLKHDFVVRRHVPVAAWTAAERARLSLLLEAEPAQAPAHPTFVNLIVTDAATGKPVQAVKLGC